MKLLLYPRRPFLVLFVSSIMLLGPGLFEPACAQNPGTDQEPDKKSPPPKTPAESARLFQVPSDLRIDPVLAEPEIAQPVFCNFDEKGRLWVVEYRQYPFPAGLKVISKDRYYRNVYDRIPAAPPNHVRGADRISIHEDTDGDGKYDRHSVFVDGLNIATSACRGRGGVWVLNPPYLLFYPDANQDDVPDGNPVVHLSGFGMEDTHSCTNSLRWGPDGWLYAAQGSTVSGNIIRPGIDKEPIRSMGQLIWRYHPEKRIYEIFAEGGGNAFGVELDSAGRIFSGHNGGDTRGFHYPQGGYLRKGFTKHGALSNPYAFGYFPHMKHPRVQRFTHNFIIYEADALPPEHRGRLFGIEPLQGRVVESEIKPRGSTFETRDLQYAVQTSDTWFTPVDIKLGPDGGIYVCDWYDDNVSHLEASEGKTDNRDGRIYRLTGKSASFLKPFDLSKKSTAELVEFLNHPNRWFRQTALRLLGDRKDRSVLPVLQKNFRDNAEQLALESLWATYQIGGLDHLLALDPLKHPNPQVRKWAFRLICDERKVPAQVRSQLEGFVRNETNVETRTQIASSAKRLPAADCFRLIQLLLEHQSDTSDPYQPLLIWWALESKCNQPDSVVRFVESVPGFWTNRIVVDHLATRLVKRFTLPGTRRGFLTVAKLLELAGQSNPQLSKMMLTEFENTTNNLVDLDFPEELLQVITRMGGASLELQVRQNKNQAIQDAIRFLEGDSKDDLKKARLIRALGDIRNRGAVGTLIRILRSSDSDTIRVACLNSLQKFPAPAVGRQIVEALPRLEGEPRLVAESVLVSRSDWTRKLLEAVENKRVSPDSLDRATPRRMLFHSDPEIASRVEKIFGRILGATDSNLRKKIDQYLAEVQNDNGSPYEGKKLFVQHCGRCHRLYQNGETVGPDLTSYQRTDVRMMMLHIVNPSAEIREGYENTLFALDDGRIINGVVKEQDNRQVVIRTAEGNDIRIEIDSIESRKAVPQSLMPTGLLDSLTPQQRRDLFAFLRSTQPLNN